MKTMQPLFNSPGQERTIAFTRRDLARLLFKHKAVILSSFAALTILVALGLIMLPPTYKTTARILIKTEQQVNPAFFSGVAAYKDSEARDPVNRTIETEMELLESRSIAEEVVRELSLTYDQVYHKPYVHLLRPFDYLYEKIRTKVFGRAPDPTKRGFDATVDELVKSIKAEPVKSKSAETNSNIVQVTLRSANAETAEKVLNRWVVIYTEYDRRLNQKIGEEAFEIVKDITSEWESNMKKAQDNLKNFIAGSQPSESGTLSVSEDRRLSGRVPERSGVFQHSGPRDQSTIGKLKEQLVDLDIQLADLQRVYSNDYEKVRKVLDNIAVIKKKLATEYQRKAENESATQSLDRDLNITETIFTELKKRQSQIDLFLKMNKHHEGHRFVIEVPLRPRTSEWKRTLLVELVGSLAGLLLGFVVAGFREYGDHTLKNQEEIEQYLQLGVIATIPFCERPELEAALTGETDNRSRKDEQ